MLLLLVILPGFQENQRLASSSPNIGYFGIVVLDIHLEVAYSFNMRGNLLESFIEKVCLQKFIFCENT